MSGKRTILDKILTWPITKILQARAKLTCVVHIVATHLSQSGASHMRKMDVKIKVMFF